MEVITGTVYEYLTFLMDAGIFGIALYNKKNDTLDYKYFIVKGEKIPGSIFSISNGNETVGGWCVKNREEILSNNIRQDHKKYILKETPLGDELTESVMFVPLQIGDEVTGLVTVQSYKKDAYADYHLNILKTLASYIAIAVENSNIHNEVQTLNRIILSEKGNWKMHTRKYHIWQITMH